MTSVFRRFALAGGLLVATCHATAALAGSFQISTVVVSHLSTANLCSSLGGRGEPPHIKIMHSKIAGVPLDVHMEDRVSGASVVDHGSTSIESSASGVTTVSYPFLSPCNQTHRLTSHYVIVVSGGGRSIERSFGGYDSANDRIVR